MSHDAEIELSTEVELVDSAPPPKPTSVGAMLSQAREERGIAIEKIADRLNLGVDVIHAIENGQTEGLPPRPFLQGHIRSFAKLVDLDLAVVIPLWEKECPPVVPEKIVPTESDKRIRRMQRGNRRMAKSVKRKKKGWLVALLLVLLVIVGFGFLSTMDKGASPINHLMSALPGQQSAQDGAAIALPTQADSQAEGS